MADGKTRSPTMDTCSYPSTQGQTLSLFLPTRPTLSRRCTAGTRQQGLTFPAVSGTMTTVRGEMRTTNKNSRLATERRFAPHALALVGYSSCGETCGVRFQGCGATAPINQGQVSVKETRAAVVSPRRLWAGRGEARPGGGAWRLTTPSPPGPTSKEESDARPT